MITAAIAELPAEYTGAKIDAESFERAGCTDIRIHVLGLTARRW
jgi:hypothetical protein